MNMLLSGTGNIIKYVLNTSQTSKTMRAVCHDKAIVQMIHEGRRGLGRGFCMFLLEEVGWMSNAESRHAKRRLHALLGGSSHEL